MELLGISLGLWSDKVTDTQRCLELRMFGSLRNRGEGPLSIRSPCPQKQASLKGATKGDLIVVGHCVTRHIGFRKKQWACQIPVRKRMPLKHVCAQ